MTGVQTCAFRSGLEAYEGRLWVDIWTTTPWTLPADDAVILHPEADYVAVVVDGRAEIMAEALVERCCARFGYESWELARQEDGDVWRRTGKDLARNRYKQPIFADQGEEGEFIYPLRSVSYTALQRLPGGFRLYSSV